MLARLQKILVASVVLVASAWLLWAWPKSHGLAVAGLALLAVSHAIFLAFEFVVVHRVNRSDPVPRAGPGEMVRAWMGESLTTPGVFLWRQPFRSRAIPDCVQNNSQRGVVLVHGFICNRGLWNPWMTHLETTGHSFAAVNLEPVFGSIEDYVPAIEEAVSRVERATGQPPLVVCHSMGGLAVRAWLRVNERAGGPDDRVHHVVTIGSPHHGTWLGRFAVSANGLEMQRQNVWLEQLASSEPAARLQRFTCFYSRCDNIVFPASTAMLPGANNQLITGLGHVDMVFDASLMRQTLALLLDGQTKRANEEGNEGVVA